MIFSTRYNSRFERIIYCCKCNVRAQSYRTLKSHDKNNVSWPCSRDQHHTYITLYLVPGTVDIILLYYWILPLVLCTAVLYRALLLYCCNTNGTRIITQVITCGCGHEVLPGFDLPTASCTAKEHRCPWSC